MIIYVWKILENHTPNMSGDSAIKSKGTPKSRRGRECVVPAVSTSAAKRIQSLRYSSFAVKGPSLFNALPRSLRNSKCTLDSFKKRLDKYLSTLPDEPLVPGYTTFRTIDSNSIIDWAAWARASGYRTDDSSGDEELQEQTGDQSSSP